MSAAASPWRARAGAGAGCGGGGPARVPGRRRARAAAGGGSAACACGRCSRGAPCRPAWSTRSPWRSSSRSPAAPGPRRRLWRQVKAGVSDRAEHNH